ncbi:MAG: tRNA (N(6)-L-threonylcarbamoyladenosine(37)-C(2))-methylthiotransferase MtaB [Clostridia bacterium]|nr:tRNA (N(6)-L-threonylcarbamoyladenosine(37)-C(2))-methylthiotransferase MtaB [Clostridia bacterium]
MKIAVLTLGCKVNKYESDALIFELISKGHCASDKLEWADAYIINTCAVTNEAEKKSRQMIERARKFNPDAKIFIMGCASQNKTLQFEERGVSFIVGTASKTKLLDELESVGKHIYELPTTYEDDMFSAQSKTRAYIKIQDGCNHFCSYCIIPYLRGRSRSREVESIIKEVERLPDEVKEVVLVGIDVSDFRIGETKGLGSLLERLDSFGKRLRLSSMEDSLIDEEFLQKLASLKNFCPHFHLSLQSGCDNVLKKMNRHYTAKEFEESVKLIRKYFPLAGITTDVIVGFPTETEEDFEETYKFVERVKFSQLHIFPYSKRDGTVASKLYKDLPGTIKNERLKKLEALGKKLKEDFVLSNKTGKVLIEEKNGDFFEGYSENYVKCYVRAQSLQVGSVVDVEFKQPFKDGAIVEVKI